MSDLFIGTSAYPEADESLLKEAGIGWVRQGFPVPFEGKIGGRTTDAFHKAKARAEDWNARGMKIMGVTPGPGVMTWKPDEQGKMRGVWNSRYPEWMGELGSEELCQNYQAICGFLADQLHGVVEMWQIANELNITQFAGSLTPDQASQLALSSAYGLKASDSSLFVGTNMAGLNQAAHQMLKNLHADPDGPINYCGIDCYFGTWSPGGPENWAGVIDELYDISGVKVLVNEWGYSSAGEVMTEDEKELQNKLRIPNCQLKKWRHAWSGGHTPEIQAQFVKRAYEIFRERREKLLGAFFYRWEDQEKCWQCGEPDCPAETAWGLVDIQGNPKPAFHAFKEGVSLISQ